MSDAADVASYPHPSKLSAHAIVDRLYEIATDTESVIAYGVGDRLRHGYPDTPECLLKAIELLAKEHARLRNEVMRLHVTRVEPIVAPCLKCYGSGFVSALNSSGKFVMTACECPARRDPRVGP